MTGTEGRGKTEPIYTVKYNKYMVTFVTNSRYNPVTRTIFVYAKDEENAKLIVQSMFDSWKWNKVKGMFMPTSRKIKIGKVEELKDEYSVVNGSKVDG